MNIIWLGHSCFAVESAGWRVVLDPYYVETYPALHIEADEALCSHGHRDHAFLEAVTLSGRDKSESPFTVGTVSTFHDDKKGSLRGENAIHILRAEGMTLVHCGDLGHELNEKQLAAAGDDCTHPLAHGGHAHLCTQSKEHDAHHDHGSAQQKTQQDAGRYRCYREAEHQHNGHDGQHRLKRFQ